MGAGTAAGREALEHARQLWDVAERKPYYDAFLGLYSQAVPALTLYQHVTNYAVMRRSTSGDYRIDYPRERHESLLTGSRSIERYHPGRRPPLQKASSSL